MSHVFISYSRRDSEAVDQIVTRLEAENFTVWIDREDIHGGDLWREAIVEAVDNAYAFVLMLSPASAASDNVRKEVDLAEGAGKSLLPTLLAQTQLPARLRYQLAGIQWIEYYRDPDKRLSELVEVLRGFEKKYGTVLPASSRQVEFVFNGLDLVKLSQEERQQLQEKLLDVIANSTNTPRTTLNVVTMTAGSVHIFVDMPTRTAYQVKTAALNKDPELIRAGIDALRLAGDRNFVPLRIAPQPPPTAGRRGEGRWCLAAVVAGIAVVALLVLSALAIALLGRTAAPAPNFSTFTVTDTPTSTSTQTGAPTGTNVPTSTPSPTRVPTDTPTDTQTPTHNSPAVFSPPYTSSDTFHGGGDACAAPKDEMIRVDVDDPDGVAGVQIYFQLQNKKTFEFFEWNSLPMTYEAGRLLPHWTVDITAANVLGNAVYGEEYWLQFYFLANDKTGTPTQSDLYGTLVTYLFCTYIT
ncbi:MAG TPA: TIR domain-containing protein [Anaerolineales bacterium]|nr:TIR domain-containing protein [Anaerolineales bacterium]